MNETTKNSMWSKFYAAGSTLNRAKEHEIKHTGPKRKYDGSPRVARNYYEEKRAFSRSLNYGDYSDYFGKDLPADQYKQDVLEQI